MALMPIDPKALLGLWRLEEMPACDEGMRLARSFLISAGEAVSMVDRQDPEHLRMEFNVQYDAFVRHCAECPKCNEV
jgi:hypothetical protein